MSHSNQYYKNRALDSLEGKWSTAVITALIYLFITEVITSVGTTVTGADRTTSFCTELVWMVLCLPLGWGMSVYFLNLIRNEDIRYARLFDGYKDFFRIFLAGLMVVLAVLAGCILFIVPGIVLAMMFSQTELILKDDRNISAFDAICKSARMMRGHKAQLFWLMLSFIGWLILSVLTLGIGFLFLEPYFETTLAHFYEDLKAESGE